MQISHNSVESKCFIQVLSVMLSICAYYAGIMLNAFGNYYAHNYAGIIGSSLLPTPLYVPSVILQSL